MPPVARVLDPTTGPGALSGPGVPTVLIGGMPVAVAGDVHTCGDPTPHPPTPVPPPPGKPTVLVGGRPVLRVGDKSACGAVIAVGCPTVVVGG
jgi:uncharacterized Zn-binding protein involved in type VI secretion